MPTAGLLFHCSALRKQRLSNPATITGMPEFSATKGPIQSRSRVAIALLVAAKGFFITAARTFYALWLEVTGLMFAVITVGGASALVRQYMADHLADYRRFLTVT